MYLCTVNNIVANNTNGMKNNGTFGLIDDLMLRGDTALLWRFGGGYVELNANGSPTSWNYYITDHLGSTRMVVDSNDSIRETISYYPFGSEMRMENPALLTGGISHPFRFTGKELDRLNGLNMYDFGARWYDVAGVPMWTSIDPLCEKYYSLSPYNYCGNNPIRFVDPNGCDWISAKYGDELFVYYDSRIKSQDDIIKHYYDGEDRDLYDIQYVGSKGTVFRNTGDGPLTYYTLNSDGSFADASGNLIDNEVSIEGLLHIGNETMINENGANQNWYGSYLGPDNPLNKIGGIESPFYAIPPKDKLDYAAFLHDKGYDSHNAVGPLDAILNPFVYAEDWHLAMKCSNDVLVSEIGTSRHFWGMAAGYFFGYMAMMKYFNGYRFGYEAAH